MKKLILSDEQESAVVILSDNTCDFCGDNKKVFEEKDNNGSVCEDCVKQLFSFIKVKPKKK